MQKAHLEGKENVLGTTDFFSMNFFLRKGYPPIIKAVSKHKKSEPTSF